MSVRDVPRANLALTERKEPLRPMDKNDFIIGPDDPILITGSGGFIGPKLVESLLDLGFRNLLCLVRPSSKTDKLDSIAERWSRGAKVKVIRGNLLSREDCSDAWSRTSS